MNVPYIDFHTHSLRQADTIEVVSLHNDQQKVVKLYTIGFHPWWTTSLLTDLQLSYLAQKFTSDANCLGIGECGLDHLKGTTLDIQEEIFLRQILIANQLNAPVIIHCVRTFDRLLSMRKKYGHTPWAVHGFVRNKILAKQILDAGICISVAPHPKMNSAFEDTLSYLPIDKIFLETDSDFSSDIKERYRIFAALRGMAIPDLKQSLYQNFITFYSEKWKHQSGWNEQHY
ncbi:MAG: TatD family hydrolase [Saprospiraceae bacterium]|nr:TatD family hydrolase [Saprospiraceae bacterium]